MMIKSLRQLKTLKKSVQLIVHVSQQILGLLLVT
nr:MAG TPA: hypothetical protein [Caudoviricetes sp.]